MQWNRARCRFDIAGPVEEGHWVLRVAPPGCQLEVRLNDAPLAPFPDLFHAEPPTAQVEKDFLPVVDEKRKPGIGALPSGRRFEQVHAIE